MAALNFEETKNLVNLVLSHSATDARSILFNTLKLDRKTEGQFYDGIVKHHRGLNLSNQEWFDLFSRLPNRLLRSNFNLHQVLSEEQIRRLPPVSG